MIGKVKGKLDFVGEDFVLIDVHGLSYVVFISEKTKKLLPNIGDQISVWTELLVREDSLKLIGFSSISEKEWYKLLVSVQGVGTKATLNLLSNLSLSQISNAIITENISLITSTQGIGPKIAKRIVTELKNNISNLKNINEEDDVVLNFYSKKNLVGINKKEDNNKEFENDEKLFEIQNDAISALVNLGYFQQEAIKVVSDIMSDNKEIKETKEIIKKSLLFLVKDKK